MDKFLMICYVAADFGTFEGEGFKITPDKIGVFVEAPAWIKKTNLYRLLLLDESIKVAEETISKKQGENDPMAGVSAEGKKEEISAAAEEARAEEKKPRARSTKAKKDDAE